MAVSYRGFLIELYEEYLSDGGFVATQRENLLAEPCGLWKRLEHWEDRIEAYIDGLCVGGQLALEVCLRRAIEGDPGDLHCALRVFHRQGRPDLIEQALGAEVNRAPERIGGVGEALKHERGPDMRDLVMRLVELHPDLIVPLSQTIGHQRLPLSDLLLRNSDLIPSAKLFWALGRLGDTNAAARLRGVPRKEDEDISATLALLRILNRLDPLEDWPCIAFGLMGAHGHFPELLGKKDIYSSLALGLLGNPSAVPELISRLPSANASLALQLITGAGLTEEKPVEDETLEPGERPTTKKQIACDPEIWRGWWKDHQSQFAGHSAFRAGLPYSPETLLSLLGDPNQTHVERYWATEQLAALHHLALSFETDMLVHEQVEALSSL